MITTGDHDDRVVPLHSHKLTATLQHVLAGEPGSLVPGWAMAGRLSVQNTRVALLPRASINNDTYHCFSMPRCTQLAPAQPAAHTHRGAGGPRRRQAHQQDHRGAVRWAAPGGGCRAGTVQNSCLSECPINCRLLCWAPTQLQGDSHPFSVHFSSPTDMFAFAAACMGAKWAAPAADE